LLLHRNGSGKERHEFPHQTDGCCGKSDCWTTEARHDPTQPWNKGWTAVYRPEAPLEDHARWVTVNDEAFEDDEELPDHVNMAGEPVLCASRGSDSLTSDPAIYCFVPPPFGF
jgi:hypothetical protein